MPDKVGEVSINGLRAGADALALDGLQDEIELHRKHESSRSYLGRAIDTVSSLVSTDDVSLADLEGLYLRQRANQAAGKQIDVASIDTAIKSDRQKLVTEEEIHHYAGGFLKTAGLFMRGKFGLAGTVAIYALDQMNPTDSLKAQLADLTLGGAKGGLMKGMFHLMGNKPVNMAAKGVGLGITSRVLEQGLTRGTYIDLSTGNVDLEQGLSKVIRGSLGREALAADVLIFGAAHGLMGKTNGLSGKAIERSPLLSTMLTGTTFGMSSGAYTEIQRELATGQSLDLSKIIKSSLIQGAIDTFAAGPGGMQARAAARASNLSKATISIESDPQRINGERFGNTFSDAGLPQQVRTFVAGANAQEVLARFDGPEAKRSGLLLVREILSQGGTLLQRLGPERTLFVQHLVNGQQFDPKAAQGVDIVAFCHPENSSALDRARHAFPEGKGPVWLTWDRVSNVLSLSLGQGPPGLRLSAARSFALGGDKPPSGSGADVEGVLDPNKPGESPMTGLPAPEKAASLPGEPPAAPKDTQSQTGPVDRTAASLATDKPPPAPVDQKLDLLSRVEVRSPEEKAALSGFAGLADKATANGANAAEHEQCIAFLRAHPELEPAIRQYESMLFDSLTTGFKPGQFTPQEIASKIKLVYLIGEFYKDGRVRVFADTIQQIQLFEYLTGPRDQPDQGLFFHLREPNQGVAASMKRQLFEFLYCYDPQVPGAETFHYHVRHYGAASSDRAVVEALDGFFKTNNLAALEQTQAWRAKAAAPKDASAPAAVSTNAQGPGTENKVEAASTLPPTNTIDGGTGGATGLDALRRAKPVAVAAAIPEAASEAATSAGVAKGSAEPGAATDRVGSLAAPKAAQALESSISETAQGLTSPSPSVRSDAYRQLKDVVRNLTDAEFLAWKTVASEINILGDVLKRPEIADIPSDLLRRFLSKLEPVTDSSVAEWAAEHVKANKELAEERARQTGRPVRPPRQPRDNLEKRLEWLDSILNTFKGEPTVSQKLIELGAQDRAALDSIMFSLSHPRFGVAYKNLLRATAPHADQVEALSYLFEFIKGGYEDGAFAALQQMRPKNTETVESLRDWIIAERTSEGKPVSDADAILAEAQHKHEELSRQADEQWKRVRRLVHDIVAGNVQGPPRGPAGGRRDGGQGGRRADAP